MKNTFCVLAALLAMAYLPAQESLKGVVIEIDAKGKILPIPFANVYWQNTNIGTVTDSTGGFQ